MNIFQEKQKTCSTKILDHPAKDPWYLVSLSLVSYDQSFTDMFSPTDGDQWY